MLEVWVIMEYPPGQRWMGNILVEDILVIDILGRGCLGNAITYI